MFKWVQQNWYQLLWSSGIMLGAIVLALVIRALLFLVLKRLAHHKGNVLGQSLVKYGQGPTHWIFPLLAVLCVLPGLPLPDELMTALEHITSIGLIGAVAWLAVLVVRIASDIFSDRYRVDVSDNLTARRVPIDPLRAELQRICQSSPLWGGKVCVLQVTDACQTTMQLRALVDARNSSDAWDLRCLVREKLIDFIQRNSPGSLPKYRGEFATPNANNPALMSMANSVH